jgi:hypothetical protein
MPSKSASSARTTFGIEHLRGAISTPRWPSRVDSLWAALLYLGLACVVLAPLFGSWSTTYVGPTFGSSQIWQMRQVWLSILAGELPPAATDLLTYPGDGAVVFVGWPFMIFGFLFRLFMPTIAAVNCTLLIFLAAGGFTMFLLAWRCSGHRGGSLLAGALYGFSTYALTSVTNGHIYSMFVLWLPLLVLSYDSFLSRMGPRTGIVFGLVVLLSAFESPYRLIEAAPFLMALTIHYLTGRGQTGKERLHRVSMSALVCVVALAGPLYYFSMQVDDGSERLFSPMQQLVVTCDPVKHPVLESAVDGGLIAEGWLDPVALVRPGFLYDDSVDRDVYNAHHIQYLGLLLPLFILAFMCLESSHRKLLLWAIILGGAMAIGPSLHWGGRAVCVGGRPLPGPMSFVNLIPATLSMGAFYRFYLSIIAAVTLTLALAWRFLTARFPARRRPWVTALAGLVLLADVAFGSPLRFPVPVVDWSPPVAATTLAAQPGRAGVLVVPDIHEWYLMRGEERLCGYVWQYHIRKPLLFRIPDSCAAYPLRSPAGARDPLFYTGTATGPACIKDLRLRGIKWVLFVGPNATQLEQLGTATGLLTDWFGPSVGPDSDDGSKLFQVP